eukprot:5259103-Prorocentrum_lima.AAC.1
MPETALPSSLECENGGTREDVPLDTPPTHPPSLVRSSSSSSSSSQPPVPPTSSARTPRQICNLYPHHTSD